MSTIREDIEAAIRLVEDDDEGYQPMRHYHDPRRPNDCTPFCG